jgi:hypothetical protein
LRLGGDGVGMVGRDVEIAESMEDWMGMMVVEGLQMGPKPIVFWYRSQWRLEAVGADAQVALAA